MIPIYTTLLQADLVQFLILTRMVDLTTVSLNMEAQGVPATLKQTMKGRILKESLLFILCLLMQGLQTNITALEAQIGVQLHQINICQTQFQGLIPDTIVQSAFFLDT